MEGGVGEKYTRNKLKKIRKNVNPQKVYQRPILNLHTKFLLRNLVLKGDGRGAAPFQDQNVENLSYLPSQLTQKANFCMRYTTLDFL